MFLFRRRRSGRLFWLAGLGVLFAWQWLRRRRVGAQRSASLPQRLLRSFIMERAGLGLPTVLFARLAARFGSRLARRWAS